MCRHWVALPATRRLWSGSRVRCIRSDGAVNEGTYRFSWRPGGGRWGRARRSWCQRGTPVRFQDSCRPVRALGGPARYASAVEREPGPVRTAGRCVEQGCADLLGGLVAGAGVERDVVVGSEGHRGVSEHVLDAFEVVAG